MLKFELVTVPKYFIIDLFMFICALDALQCMSRLSRTPLTLLSSLTVKLVSSGNSVTLHSFLFSVMIPFMSGESDTSVTSGSVIRLNRKEDNGQPCLTDFLMANIDVKWPLILTWLFALA